jgi:hypothetical protein
MKCEFICDQEKREIIFCLQLKKTTPTKVSLQKISVHFFMIDNLQSQNAFMRAAQDGRSTLVFLLLGLGATVNLPDKVSEMWMFPDSVHSSCANVCLIDIVFSQSSLPDEIFLHLRNAYSDYHYKYLLSRIRIAVQRLCGLHDTAILPL